MHQRISSWAALVFFGLASCLRAQELLKESPPRDSLPLPLQATRPCHGGWFVEVGTSTTGSFWAIGTRFEDVSIVRLAQERQSNSALEVTGQKSLFETEYQRTFVVVGTHNAIGYERYLGNGFAGSAEGGIGLNTISGVLHTRVRLEWNPIEGCQLSLAVDPIRGRCRCAVRLIF
jgi:hypothetical protein